MSINYFLFQIYPYIAITVFILGSIVRFDQNPYSWRTKSSQIFRRKQLFYGSILFHLGVIVIFLGHFFGLLTPIKVFEMLGIVPAAKQMMAMVVGGIAGVFCLIGILLLLHRRLFDKRIFATSSKMDIIILVLIFIQLLLGLLTIPYSMQFSNGHEIIRFMNWAQHIVTFRGNAYLFVTGVPIVFKLHIVLGLTILLLFPFTRLVHILSAPVWYIFRPYQIVRKRER